MMPRRLPSFASGSDVRTLRKTAEPGLRAAALWWAEALVADLRKLKSDPLRADLAGFELWMRLRFRLAATD
jgi:hypothetical protein